MSRWQRRPVVWLPISGFLLVLVAWRSRMWEAGESLTAPDLLPIALAVLLNLAVVALWAVRSWDLLDATGHPVALRPLLPIVAFANTVNNLTPGSAGEVVRAWFLRAHHKVPYAVGAAVIVVERVTAIGYMAASALVAWVGHAMSLPWPLQVGLLILVTVSPGVVYRLGFRPAAALGRLPAGGIVGRDRWERVRTVLARIDDTIATILTSPGRLAVFAATTALVFAAYTVQLCLVASSVGITLDPVAAWGALGLATVAGVLSLLPFGLGATDLVLASLLASLGVPPSAAAAIAFGYRLVSTLPLGILGTASYIWLSARLPAGGTRAVIDAVPLEMAENRPDGAP